VNLIKALRLDNKSAPQQTISFVGAGGKTSALFQLAREMVQFHSTAIVVTATTHLGARQTSLADHHIIAKDSNDLKNFPNQGVILVTGEIENDRTKPVNELTLNWLRENTLLRNTPLLIEADGSRQKPLKAPASHEPAIPEFSDIVIVVAGLSGLGKSLTDEHVHRGESFSQLSSLQIDQPVTPDALTRVLIHPQGGLKNIPSHARRIVFLNQADTSALQSTGGNMARHLLDHFDSVILGSLKHNSLQTFEQTAGIILAAGESTRFGAPKQLLDWKGKPFVRHVAETALQSGLWPVVVVTGFRSADIESTLSSLPVSIVHNPEYNQGQSTSIKTGINALPTNAGATVFLLADQPQIPVEVIRALLESHAQNLQPILAPLVLEERRANPVLFDRVTFPDLLTLTGDIGGRGIFDKYRVEYLPWHDDILLFDVDKPEDYQRLKEME
jgi:molybdenum cofactor cytidylyltransferase